MPHVRQAVVCDCLQLPIGPGHFDVILANHFLHHVTMKGKTLANWARVSRRLILNENTPFWASSWSAPFLLRKLGAAARAQRLTDAIERDGLQHLEPKEALAALVREDYDVIAGVPDAVLLERRHVVPAAGGDGVDRNHV